MQRATFESLCRASPEALARAARAGAAPEPASLEGWEFRGWYAAGSLPGLLARKHRKGFYRLARAQGLGGYNVPCHPGGPDAPWIDRLRGPGSWRLGWFLVTGTGPRRPPSLLLDYSRDGRAHPLNPLRAVREHLVQVSPDDPDLMLSLVEIHVGRQVRQAGMAVYERHALSPVGL
jgi:hypothetical protein